MSVTRWWARLSALVSAVALSLFVPAVAWASPDALAVADEVERRRRSVGGGFGLLGTLCCLVVVALVVVGVVLMARRRQR